MTDRSEPYDLSKAEYFEAVAEMRQQSLRRAWDKIRKFRKDIDQLKAENESVNKHRANESNNVQALTAEVVRLKAENEALRAGQPTSCRSCEKLQADNVRLQGMLAEWDRSLHGKIVLQNLELRKSLAECAASLEGEVLQKFHGQSSEDMHPVTRREYDRDMAEIEGYKALSKEG